MNEKLLQFVWQQKLFSSENCFTCDGERLVIHKTGFLNTNAGADFSNAHVQIGDVQWYGDVEVHKKSSDWQKHKHHVDKAYDKVILHVVLEDDVQIKRTNGTIIPTFELQINEGITQMYNKFQEEKIEIPCSDELKSIHSIEISSWLASLATMRLEDKVEQLKMLHESLSNDWEQACFIMLARSFGLRVNALPFEMFAKSINFKILAKHRDNLIQIEALLFGQAGLLSEAEGDEYYNQLKKEYSYLQQKYSLKPIESHVWKFLRIRPFNFPTLRIAQLAAIIFNHDRVFSKLMDIKTIKSLETLFQQETSTYWKTHYLFGKNSNLKIKQMGSSSIKLLVINTVVPLQFYYGIYKNKEEYKQNALKLLENISAESNHIIKIWNRYNIKPGSALESQALLHLYNNFCDHRRCVECRIGNLLLLRSYSAAHERQN